MKVKAVEFADELEVFRVEVESAIQFFYSYCALNASLVNNQKALNILALPD